MTSTADTISLVRSVARRAAERALQLAPVPVWRRLFPKAELGVCYHMVSNDRPRHIKHYRVLDTAAFGADLAYLERNFDFISYDQLVQRRDAPNRARDNAMLLTFDDGFAECASVVAPLLRSRGLSCVFFVITDLIDNAVLFRESQAALCVDAILALPAARVEAMVEHLGLSAQVRSQAAKLDDPALLSLDVADLGAGPEPGLRPLLHWLLNLPAEESDVLDRLSAWLGVDPQSYLTQARPYLTTEQIRQLHADGFTIGAHSRSHRRLQTLPRAEAEREIVESCRAIRDITGQAQVPFAFPYFGGDLDRAWLAGLRARHDVIGLFFDTDGLREDEPFVVQRVFGERFGIDRTMDAILRRAWSRRPAWRRHAWSKIVSDGSPGS